MQGLKRIAELPSKAFKETSNQIETADLEIKEMNNQILGRGFSEDDKKRLDYLNNNVSKSVTETIEKPAYKHKDPWTVLGALEKFPYSAKYAYAAALKQLPILYNIGKESLIGGIGGGGQSCRYSSNWRATRTASRYARRSNNRAGWCKYRLYLGVKNWGS